MKPVHSANARDPSLPSLRLQATTAKRRRPPKSRATSPLTLGEKSPIMGPRLKGGGLLAAACATGGSAACKPEGVQQPRHPGVRGTATAVVTPSPSTYYSTSAFELPARSPSLTPEPHEANSPRT
uniref:Uncharacterized protein n=1 Tax=Hyaloperonospora arabidopsidis (strain Emoy2) TaxID=559515 RepID=M4BLB9_HYAAE